jgi:hypothetical protein
MELTATNSYLTHLCGKENYLKTFFLLGFVLLGLGTRAQHIDSMYINLYTDSLKKGTYNYINADGLLSNGKYIPLDSNQLIFRSSYGKFYGNNLWIDSSSFPGPVEITITLKKDPSVQKKIILFIKRKEEEKIRTTQELLDEMKQQQKKRKQLKN